MHTKHTRSVHIPEQGSRRVPDSSASGSVETEQDDPISIILVGSKKI